jgi:hypothetical protein
LKEFISMLAKAIDLPNFVDEFVLMGGSTGSLRTLRHERCGAQVVAQGR